MKKFLPFCLLLISIKVHAQTCSTDTVSCNVSLQSIIGTDTTVNTKTEYPSAYGNWYTSAKHQFLYLASELHDAGMITACKIDQIDFNVSAVYGTTLYHNYTINMGCTSLSSLNNWTDSTENVYTPKNHTITIGWNSHPLDLSYEWDGVSNLIVDICFYEGPGIHYTYNSCTQYSTTLFSSCLYAATDAYNICQDYHLITPNVVYTRPNIRLHSCAIATTTSSNNLDGDDFKAFVFPNPSNGNFEIAGPAQIYMIEIYDQTGEKIYYNEAQGTISVLLNAKLKGIYFYRIYCAATQKIYTGKIMVID